MMAFERPLLQTLVNRLKETHPKIQVLSGARQVGKTTLSLQALKKIDAPHHYAIAESGFTVNWVEQQWGLARSLSQEKHAILVIDEVQKIANWSERVKRLWDEDRANRRNLAVLLLGSSSLLLHKGLSESMAGRYEVIPVPHWSFAECQSAFNMSVDDYIYFGGYPGALPFIHDEDRFLSYIQDSIIEPVVTRDILSQFTIHKPALLRELFRLGAEYSGQIFSFNKMLGQMQDAGNTTTLAHYLTLLDQAGVLKGVHKYAHEPFRQRQSSPKFQVYNTALMAAVLKSGFKKTMEDPELKGRFVESTVGAHLLTDPKSKIYYWRENNKEIDFVVQTKGKTVGIEVKSGKKTLSLPGLDSFKKQFEMDATLLVGTGGIPLEHFFTTPFEHFV